MQKIFNTGKLLILLLSIGGLLASCESREKKPEVEKGYVVPDTVMQTLKIDTVAVSPLVNAITLTGKVGTNDDNVVPVYALVSGNVQDIKVNLGDYVQAGQVLAVVRSQEMAQYSSDLLNAETNLSIASAFTPVQLGTDAVFKTPFCVWSGEGSFQLSSKERENLKKYLTSGGFIVASPGTVLPPCLTSISTTPTEVSWSQMS